MFHLIERFQILAPRKGIYVERADSSKMVMDTKWKSYLAIVMGIIILIADIYWLVVPVGGYYSYQAPPWLVAGIIILVADLVWIWIDYDLMKK